MNKNSSIGMLMAATMSCSAAAQDNGAFRDRLSDLFDKADELTRAVYDFKSADRPSDAACLKIKSDISEFYSLDRKFIEDVQRGLTFETDRNFVRLDMFTAGVKLGGFFSNALSAVNYTCDRSNPYAKDFANLYYELMQSSIELGKIWQDKARKTYIN